MNITKDFHDYISSTTNKYPQYKFKCDQHSPIDKCRKILSQINEVERNINQITSMSKKSSAFNDNHLKFSNASTHIKRSLMDIDNQIKSFKLKELQNQNLKRNERKLLTNCYDLLNQKISDLTSKFQKFLKHQAELIKKVEQRKSNLSLDGSHSTKTNSFNEFINPQQQSPSSQEEEDVLINVQSQTTRQSNYYQSRLNQVQSIEKTMSEIGGMVARLGQMTYTQSIMIENIGTNTQEAYDNVEAGANEVKKMLDDVKSNRGLLIKIFLIVIVTSVVYILLFA
jgi:syntaxin 5